MQKPLFYVLVGIFVLAVVAGVLLFLLPTPAAAPEPNQNATTTLPRAELPGEIIVETPRRGALISSPMEITGSAAGWYFEASFPVELRNASGQIIAQHYAQAQSDWMTAEFVAFKSTLSFPPQPKGSQGTLILRKDNPSGLPENDRSIEIPVVF